MEKVRIGVLGAYRGTSMINYCKQADNAEVVAICDKSPDALESQRKKCEGFDIAFYDNFDDFIQHDMDAVVLANYANEHAPFAIRAMKAGKHVFSELLPVQNMKEAVELVETVEATGKVYAYGENCCFMAGPYEMYKLYKAGRIGEFEYGECEYIHNCEPIWPSITYGEPVHWRNRMYSTFYCTHSLGPIIHMTGLRPVSVIGIEGTKNERCLRNGSKGGPFGIEMVTLENGGIIKSVHGVFLYGNSTWFSVYGSKGSMETGRKLANDGKLDRIYVSSDEYSGGFETTKREDYYPTHGMEDRVVNFGHGGSDFYSMYFFVEKILGNPDADIIDVYEALDMFLPGLFGYFSILDGSAPKQIPNLRDPAQRDAWRNNTACVDPKAAGDQLLPTNINGTPEIDPAVYANVKQKWDEEKQKKGSYKDKALSQGEKK